MADAGGNRIAVFSSSACRAGISGGGAGQLSFPVGVTTDTAGDFYVGDFSNSRIDKFTSSPPTVPGPPTIGTAVAGDGSATVSWTAPASDGGSPIVGYVVTGYVGFAPVRVRIFNPS